MRRKLQTERVRQHCALRMKTVKPVFGHIRQDRDFRQFQPRGMDKVNREWSLICTSHNLLMLFRFGNSVIDLCQPSHPNAKTTSPTMLPLPSMANAQTGC